MNWIQENWEWVVIGYLVFIAIAVSIIVVGARSDD